MGSLPLRTALRDEARRELEDECFLPVAAFVEQQEDIFALHQTCVDFVHLDEFHAQANTVQAKRGILRGESRHDGGAVCVSRRQQAAEALVLPRESDANRPFKLCRRPADAKRLFVRRENTDRGVR